MLMSLIFRYARDYACRCGNMRGARSDFIFEPRFIARF